MMHPEEGGNIRKIVSERRHLENGIWEEAFGVIRGASSGRILRRFFVVALGDLALRDNMVFPSHRSRFLDR